MTAKRDLLKRIDRRTKMTLRQVQIDHGIFQAGMSQKKLNGSQVSSRFTKVCRKGVPHGVRTDDSTQARTFRRTTTGVPDGFVGDGVIDAEMAGAAAALPHQTSIPATAA